MNNWSWQSWKLIEEFGKMIIEESNLINKLLKIYILYIKKMYNLWHKLMWATEVDDDVSWFGKIVIEESNLIRNGFIIAYYIMWVTGIDDDGVNWRVWEHHHGRIESH